MGGRPLRSPTHRRHGGPLPRRLPNGTHAHPEPPRGFPGLPMRVGLVRGINLPFGRLPPCSGQVAYALRTRAPVAGVRLPGPAAPRLACVRPVASVHPEPGSNSSLYDLLVCLFPAPARRLAPPARGAGPSWLVFRVTPSVSMCFARVVGGGLRGRPSRKTAAKVGTFLFPARGRGRVFSGGGGKNT